MRKGRSEHLYSDGSVHTQTNLGTSPLPLSLRHRPPYNKNGFLNSRKACARKLKLTGKQGQCTIWYFGFKIQSGNSHDQKDAGGRVCSLWIHVGKKRKLEEPKYHYQMVLAFGRAFFSPLISFIK